MRVVRDAVMSVPFSNPAPGRRNRMVLRTLRRYAGRGGPHRDLRDESGPRILRLRADGSRATAAPR
ncbi:hypothetical protein C5C41_14300 [Rathayibacter sp. AY1E9]|nr:hypothetical protein C5C54_02790 [Rathayibacter sp. AY1F2]PPG50097.1 hypothetical protein C5C41_14300 [Rathayibacter sp. AY1E9]